MDQENFEINQPIESQSIENEIEHSEVEEPAPAEMLDEERKELEEEWIKICKKEYSLFECVKSKEEILRAQKLKLRNLIKDRYQAELASHNSTEPIQISIDSESYFYIKQLEKRQEDLKLRMNKLEEEIKVANKDKTFLSHDKTNFMLKEKIHEFLYENEVLEKYLRGEYFRTFDETISGLKNSLEVLNKDKDTLTTVKRQLESEESSILDTIYNLKKEYKESLAKNEQLEDGLEYYQKSESN
jgi:hypothetical protein